MALPNFFIIGAVKSGTGALHQYLGCHPEIFMSPLKEPRFFLLRGDGPHDVKNKSIPIKTLADYEDLFSKSSTELARGESSSNYLPSPRAANAIFELVPEAKLVVSLRNPVERAIAHYEMINPGATASRDLLLGEKENWARSSLYTESLRRYIDLFGADRVNVLIMEEWKKNPGAALAQLFGFLGVDDDFTIDSRINYKPAQVYSSKIPQGGWVRWVKPLIPDRVKHLLKRRQSSNSVSLYETVPREICEEMWSWYEDDVDSLSTLLDRELTVWTSAYGSAGTMTCSEHG